MFELNEEEFQEWRSQFGTSNEGDKMGLRYAPYVFTEQGVAMLSGVLNSERAIKVNIQIMRIYSKMREKYPGTSGHGTHSNPAIWGNYLKELLEMSGN